MSEKQLTLYWLIDKNSIEDDFDEPKWVSQNDGIETIGLVGKYTGTIKNGEPHGEGKITVMGVKTIDVYFAKFDKVVFHKKGTRKHSRSRGFRGGVLCNY